MNIKKLISAAAAMAMLLTAQPQTAVRQDALAAAKSRVSVHDPSIFKDDDGMYYVFGSHIDAAKSTDLQSWTSFTNGYAKTNNAIFGDLSGNLKKAFAWAGEDLEDCENGFAVWAPDVLYNPAYINEDGSKGAYMMYFCTSSTYMRSVIGFAVSQNAAGPYKFVDTLIYSGFTNNDSYATSATKNVNRKYTSTNVDELIAAGQVTFNKSWFNKDNYNNQLFPNAIDPTIYYDTDGNMHMCYGSWSGGIFTLDIDPATGYVIHPKSGTTSDGRMIDSYFGTKISGGYGKSGEAPYIRYNPDTGYYYLWVTYGGLFSDGGYNMRVFRSTSPTGPFTDPAGNQAVLPSAVNIDPLGLKVMGNYKFSSLNTAYMACGHNSVLRDDDGQWYLFNHARFDDGTEYHEVRVHAIYFNSEGWPVTAPYEYSGDVMSKTGYNVTDIAGDYEFVNHELDTSKTIHNAVKITLNADGTISGAAEGTWEQAPDSAQANFVIGGDKYEGYFLPTQDEKTDSTKVMTFTAAGSNNKSVWGVQTKAYTGSDRKGGSADYTNTDSRIIYAPETAPEVNNASFIGNSQLLSGISYYITNKNSGLLLEVKGGKTDAGTNIQQWEMNVGPYHEWRICDVGGGYCKLLLKSDETMAVTVDGNDGTNGLNVYLDKYTGADNQLFKLVKDGMYYAIVSKCSNGGACLDVYEWSEVNGGNVNQWEYWGGDCQLWKIEPVYPAVNDGEYIIRDFSEFMGVNSDGDLPSVNSKAMVWTITKYRDGTYTIKDRNGKALTVDNSSDAGRSTPITLSEYTGDDSQKFRIICAKDGSYIIQSALFDTPTYVAIEPTSAILEECVNFRLWNNEYTHGLILEPAPPAKAVIGDVNNDGEFTVADLVMLSGYLLGKSDLTAPEAGDLCADGTIDTFDLVSMRKLITEG